MASSADGMTSRWSGTQLAVGVLGRHRRCCVELDTRAGILRLLDKDGRGLVSIESLSWRPGFL